MSAAPTRPVLRYHGGKWRIAPRIIAMMPAHQVYVEPYCGAASVLLRKPRAYAEVINDLDGRIVSLFRLLRDPEQTGRLFEALTLTPFALAEFEDSYGECDEPVEAARRLIVRSFMGFGSTAVNDEVRTGFRANSNRSSTTPAHDWANFPSCLSAVTSRLLGVVVEHRDALQVMEAHDRPETLHYVDPPYMPDTRSAKSRRGGTQYHAYKHDMEISDHVRLLEYLQGLEGMVMISGYHHALYDEMLRGWERREFAALADGAKERIEVVWLNPAAAASAPKSEPEQVGFSFEGAA